MILYPKADFKKVSDITIEYLNKNNIKALILDVDNTLIDFYKNLSEQTINPVIITITGVSILIGSSLGTRKLHKNGMISGGIIGASYILLLYLISSIVNSNFSINWVSIIMIIVGLIGGIFGGVIGVNTK